MKYLFESLLNSKGISSQNDIVTPDMMESKSPEKMVHVIIFTDESKRPYQVLFSGDRILNLKKIKAQAGNDNLKIDKRFYPIPNFPVGNYRRISPLLETQGCHTYIDESLMFKQYVHVATTSSTMGVWISPKSLREAFPKSKICSVSDEGTKEGFLFEQSDENDPQSVTPQTRALQKAISSIGWNIKPIVFESTRRELLTLRSIGEADPEELAELINIDFSLHPFFFVYYCSTMENEMRLNLTTVEMIEAIGAEKTLNYLSGLMLSEDVIPAHRIAHGFGGEVFKCMAKFSFLMRDITTRIQSKFPEADPQYAENLARVSRFPKLIWRSLAGYDGSKSFVEELKLNPHRFPVEIQESKTGFTEDDVSKLLLRVYKLPVSTQNALNNHTSPFYNGPDAFYANLMYIVMSYLVEKGLVGRILFTPFHKMHRFMAKEMGILEEISQSLLSLEDHRDNFTRLSWRFERSSKVMKEQEKVDRVDALYYIYKD